MNGNDETLALRDYLAVLRQQLRLIAVVVLIATLLGVGYFLLQTPEYRATAELQLERVRTAQDITLSELLNPTGVITDAEVATASSLPVADAAAAQLGRSDAGVLRSKVDVSVVEGTQRMRFAAIDTDPEQAARIADAFANAFIELRRDQAVTSVDAARAELEQRAAELRTEIDAIDDQIAQRTPSDQFDFGTSGDAGDGTVDEAVPATPELETLQLRRQALQSQLSQVIQRSTELGTSADALTGFSAGFTPAAVPSEPIGTDWVNTLGVSFVLGLFLGIALAFARDHFDDVLRGETDLKRATGGLPVLGRIPTWKPPKGDAERLASLVDPSSHTAEAYRELSAGVRFMLVARAQEITDGSDGHHGLGRSRSVLVSSANIGEGKTATAANLAVATARVGMRTILVDADLRRSAVARRFGLPRMVGLADALLNGEGPKDYLVDVGVPSLRVLPAGTTPPNPTELLASAAMRAMHRQLLASADLVIYDSPAVLAVADTLELGPFVDLGVIVGRVRATTRRRMQSAIERLSQVGTDLSGAVLNGATHESEGYYYEEYYEAPDPDDVPDDTKRQAPPDEPDEEAPALAASGVKVVRADSREPRTSSVDGAGARGTDEGGASPRDAGGVGAAQGDERDDGDRGLFGKR